MLGCTEVKHETATLLQRFLFFYLRIRLTNDIECVIRILRTTYCCVLET